MFKSLNCCLNINIVHIICVNIFVLSNNNLNYIYCANNYYLLNSQKYENVNNGKSVNNSMNKWSSVTSDVVFNNTVNQTLRPMIVNINKSQTNGTNDDNIDTNNIETKTPNYWSHISLISKIKHFIESNNDSVIGDEVKLRLMNGSINGLFESNISETLNDNVIRRWKINNSPPDMRNALTLNDKKKELKIVNVTKDLDTNVGQTVINGTVIKDIKQFNSNLSDYNNSNNNKSNRVIKFLDNTVLFEVILIIALFVILVPFMIIICTTIIVWVYRKRYPVRMRFGRKFGTIENPDYKLKRDHNMSQNSELKQFS